MSSKQTSKITQLPTGVATEQIIQYPELFTEEEASNQGEVLSTTDAGCIFVLKNDKVVMFQPVARKHISDRDYYYTMVEFR